MKVVMKHYEKLAADYAERFRRVWDSYIIASDAYLNGYRRGYDDALQKTNLADPVEVEFKDGSHVIGAKMSGGETSER